MLWVATTRLLEMLGLSRNGYEILRDAKTLTERFYGYLTAKGFFLLRYS